MLSAQEGDKGSKKQCLPCAVSGVGVVGTSLSEIFPAQLDSFPDPTAGGSGITGRTSGLTTRVSQIIHLKFRSQFQTVSHSTRQYIKKRDSVCHLAQQAKPHYGPKDHSQRH